MNLSHIGVAFDRIAFDIRTDTMAFAALAIREEVTPIGERIVA